MKTFNYKFRTTLTLTLLLLGCLPARGQYYDWGQSPASISWRTAGDSSVRVLYPDYFESKALSTMHYLGAVRPFVSHGFEAGPMRVPVVLHTQNFNPNGIVMLAPRRMELLAKPGSGGSYATPWLKQLAVHEYRHAVQYNNLNTGFIKAFRYLLGEQGWMLGTWGLPLWMMEGDAVMAETQFTSFGRGVQPSFTLEYRAMHGQALPRYSVDKYFSGSYRDFIPDHYQLGYQLISYAYERYGESVTDKVGRFWARNPYFIFTTNIALKKFYGTTEKQLLNQAFDALERHWDSIPAGRDDFDLLTPGNRSYTTYKSPILAPDSLIYAIKSDMGRYSRLVSIDARGRERTLRHTGFVHTPPVLHGGKLYWTELRSSTFWEQRVNSALSVYDLSTGRKSTLRELGNVLYPTFTADGELIYAAYDYDGSYVVHMGSSPLRLPDSISLHGLSCDKSTGRVYFIGLSDDGMWIGEIADGTTFRQVTTPSRVAIDNLSAADGRLFYNSIYSGRDEIHIYDLAGGKEYRLTDSKYGSFNPTLSADGKSVTFVSYGDSKRGYVVAHKSLNRDSLTLVAPSYLPENLVNPPRRRWDLFNIDTVDTERARVVHSAPKRYRRAAHLINVHSWAPLYFEPEKVLEDFELNLRFGATLISQNLLSSMTSRAGYGYSSSGGHMVGAAFKYYGWAPKFELSGRWGDGDRSVSYFPVPGGTQLPHPEAAKQHFNITLTAFLPITIDNGYHIRRIVPMVELSHNNGLLLKSDMTGFHAGYQRLAASVYYSDNVRMAYRDFLPRFGYFVRASSVSSPFGADFGDLWSAFGRAYLPGVAAHHSLTLRGMVQHQRMGIYNFSRKELYPRGTSYTLLANRTNGLSVDYQLPVCYPDWGINSLLFLKRIRLNLGYDYADLRLRSGRRHELRSYGGDIYVDLTVNRMPAAATSTIKVSVYKSSDEKLFIGAGLTLPI